MSKVMSLTGSEISWDSLIPKKNFFTSMKPFKSDKKYFYVMLKALFILEIFTFLS